MKGTKKQLSWATEIQANVIKTLENMVETAKADPRYDPENPAQAANIAGCEQLKAAAAGCDYAGDMIEVYGGIRFNGDLAHDFDEIMAVYRVKLPSTAGGRKLILKK